MRPIVLLNLKTCNKLSIFNDCLDAIKKWMADNFLQLNEDKTEALIIAPENAIPRIRQCIGSLSVCVQHKCNPCLSEISSASSRAHVFSN